MDAPEETVDVPMVEDADGNSLPVGLSTSKKKVYDKNGQQITKSCHICQGQHIFWECGEGCRASYCSRCSQLSGMTVSDGISQGCPKCNHMCVCLKCLRSNNRLDLVTVPLQERLELLLLPPPSKRENSPRPGERLTRRLKQAAATVAARAPKRKRGRPRKHPAPEMEEQQEKDVLVEREAEGSFREAMEASMERHSSRQDTEGPQPGSSEASEALEASEAPTPEGTSEAPPAVTVAAGEGGVVMGEGNAVYAVGQSLGKTKILDPNGSQISKSCHQCQDQHIAFRCKTGKEGCKASYCRRCCDKYYVGLKYKEIMEKCPRCRGFCSCRGCLRAERKPSIPEHSKEMMKSFAEHILKCIGSQIAKVLRSYDAEVASDGVRLEEVGVEASRSGRMNCKRCSASILDLFRSCQNCGLDICIVCCGDLRRIFGNVVCPTCSSPLKAKNQLDPQMLEDLRAIVKEYGDCKASASGPSWRRAPKDSDETAGKKKGKKKKKASISCEESNGGHWSERVDDRMVRICSTHPSRKYVFCPTSSDLETSDEAHQVFQECMRRGEPVIVRNVKGIMDWRPETMCRAMVERGNKYYGVEAKAKVDLTVIDCTENWEEFSTTQRSFFQEYRSTEEPSAMLKVKDWPPAEPFQDRLKLHNLDFLEMLPMKEYTNPVWGPLNMYRALPEKRYPADVGPKAYVALGRKEEHPGEGDSVRKLHVHMSDTINVLLDACSPPEEETEEKVRLGEDLWEVPSYGNAAAVWDLVRREDVEKVSEYLRLSQDAFLHNGEPVREHGVKDPILEEMFQLRSQDRTALERNYGIHLWHLEQHLNEAVYIPAGVPHQVRNLKNCIKVAVDFVPPESAGQVLHLGENLREFALCGRGAGVDKLQGVATMLFAAREAYQIKSGKSDSIAIKVTPEPKKTKKRKGGRPEPDQ